MSSYESGLIWDHIVCNKGYQSAYEDERKDYNVAKGRKRVKN